LAALLHDPPHSLMQQAIAPREQRVGRMNADGFGVGWYAPQLRAEPARYRSARPIWSDRSLASLAGVVTAPCILAAVRSATRGFPVEESGAAPFSGGRWLFSHNGRVERWADAGPVLHALLPAGAAVAVESPSDAALLWALLRARLAASDAGPGALPAALTDVLYAAVAAGGEDSRLNLLATDGERLAATVWNESLYVLDAQADGVRIASEPLDDDPRWQRAPDRTLVSADATGIVLTRLDQLG
jgi:glutamine amidotransferase